MPEVGVDMVVDGVLLFSRESLNVARSPFKWYKMEFQDEEFLNSRVAWHKDGEKFTA